jgi:tetratricopeptide (TPR) repeat protein
MDWAKKEIIRRREAIEAAAKKEYLANNIAEARDLLQKRNCEFWINRCSHENANPEMLFIRWDMDAGNLSKAAQRVAEGEDTPTAPLLYHINLVGRAFVDALMYKEGIEFLSKVRDKIAPSPTVATLYWFLGARDEARQFLRRAVKHQLESAEKDTKRVPPAHLAGTQLQMNDREGALSTFKALRVFDEQQFTKIRATLAGRMALANLEEEAFALLKGDVRDHSALANIAVAQARRGNHDAAFRTIERIGSLPSLRQHEASPSNNPSVILPIIEDRNPSARDALVTIMRIAARTGDLSMFRRANRVAATLEPKQAPSRPYDSPSETPRLSGPYVFEDLTRAGHANFALEAAQSIVRLPEKIAALCATAEALVLPAELYNPFVFFEGW